MPRASCTFHATCTLVLLLGALLLASGMAAASIAVQILDKPDVVVTTDFDGEAYTTPRYLFSSQIRATNDDTRRTASFSVIMYFGEPVDGCPEQRGSSNFVPVVKANKQLELDPRETATLGGKAREGQGGQAGGQGDAFWPMEVFRTYPQNDGSSRDVQEGRHTFCALAIVSENDPACDQPQACWLGTASFRAYVRNSNEAPHITEFSVTPEVPRPGQEAVLRVQAQDNDTVPKPDTITYRWDLGPEDKQGPVIRHAFNTPGTKPVTLTVSDGFVTVQRQLNITVAGQGTGGNGGEDTNGSPSPGTLVALVIVGAAALLRRRAGSHGPRR